MKAYLKASFAIATAIGLTMAATGPAHAEAAEFYKCTLKEGASMKQLVAVTSGFLKTAKANGHGDYSVRFLSPLYSADTKRGVFWWVGVGPNVGSVAAENDYWVSDANAEHRKKTFELIDDCESSSLHEIISVKAAE